MNRRGFLKFLGAATVGSAVAYSFPSIIVPKNIDVINLVTQREIFPRLIEDNFFQDTPFMSYMRQNYVMKIVDDSEYGFGYVEQNGVWVHEVVKSEPETLVEATEPIFFLNSKEMKIIPKSEKPILHRIFGMSN